MNIRLSFALLFVPLFSFSQVTPSDIKPLTFASPNVSSLGRYGEIPVGHFTGVPKVDIPIYEVIEGDIRIPINLSYHASGIKVQDVASSVGLGWTLNAGGVIMREIRDIPDDGDGGFCSTGGQTVKEIAGHMQPLYTNANMKKILGGWDVPSTQLKLKLSDIVNKEFDPNYVCPYPEAWRCVRSPGFLGVPVDGQSDIYYFTTPSASGKFFFKNNGDVLLMPLQNLKVMPDPSEVTPFQITDENGLVYTFKEEGERSSESPWLYSNSINYLTPKNYETSWSLDNVKDKSGNTVKFHYSRHTILYNTLSSEGSVPYPPNIIHSLVQVTSDRLDSITSAHYKVVFYSKTVRQDLGGFFHDESLDSIKVLNSEKKVIKTVKLHHSYFVGNPGENITWSNETWGDDKAHLRLRLDSVVINSDQVYRFSYDETPLPSRFSKKIDLWGYYNGATNTTLIPTFFGTLEYSGRKYDYIGGNRRPNPDVNQAGILKTITYPTGGSTQFEYEPNDVKARKHHIVPQLVPIQHNIDVFVFSGTSSTIAMTRPFNIRYGYLGGTIKISPLASTVHWWDKVKIEFVDAATGGSNYIQDITPYWDTGTGDIRTVGIPTSVPGDYLIRVKGTSSYAMVMLEVKWDGPVEELVDPATITTTIGNHFVYPGGTNTIVYPITITDLQGEIRTWASSDYSNDIEIEVVDAETEGAIFRKAVAPPTGLTPNVTLLPDRPGNYLLKSRSSNASAFFHMEVAWKDMGPVENRIVGGLRVKRTIDHDPLSGSEHITTYKYRFEDDGESSSGEIFNYPVHYNEHLTFTVLDNCSLTYNPGNFFNQNGSVKFTSYSTIPLSVNTDGQVGYSSVIVEKGSSKPTRSIYTYSNVSSSADFKLYPGYDYKTTPYISVGWTRGLLLTERHFLNSGSNLFTKIQETVNCYKRSSFVTDTAYTSLGIAINPSAQLFYNENTPEGAQRIQNCLYSDGAFSANLINWRPFLWVTGWNTLDSTIVKTFSGTQELRSVTRYQYYTPTTDGHFSVKEKSERMSDGSVLKETYRYPMDYRNLASSNEDAIGVKHLQNINLTSAVIESCSFIKQKGYADFKLTAARFVQYYPTQGRLKRIYTIENKSLLSDFSPSSVSSGALIRDNRYQLKGTYNRYTTTGKLQEIQKANDIKTSYVWGYDQEYVIAEVSNAGADQVFYTGFETDGVADEARTGKKSWNSGPYAVPFVPPSDGQSYKMSYWYRSADQWIFSGEIPYSATINKGSRLDDIRVYPAGAMMTTYTYTPGVGITSVSDANNITTFYEYDAAGRLKAVKDASSNVVKTFHYHYQGQ